MSRRAAWSYRRPASGSRLAHKRLDAPESGEGRGSRHLKLTLGEGAFALDNVGVGCVNLVAREVSTDRPWAAPAANWLAALQRCDIFARERDALVAGRQPVRGLFAVPGAAGVVRRRKLERGAVGYVVRREHVFSKSSMQHRD